MQAGGGVVGGNLYKVWCACSFGDTFMYLLGKLAGGGGLVRRMILAYRGEVIVAI